MNFYIFLSILLFANLTFSAEIELAGEYFDLIIKEYPIVIVMFYDSDCANCIKLQTEYTAAEESMGLSDPPIIFAKVNCTGNGQETCSRLSISTYPTLKIFIDKKMSHEYDGPHVASEIVKHMQSQVSSPSKEISSVDEYDSFLNVHEAAVFGYFETESDLRQAFLKVAEENRRTFRFGHSSDAKVLNVANEKDAVYIYRPSYLSNDFEPSSVKFTGKSSKELDEFIKKNQHGLAGHRTVKTKDHFKNPLIVAYFNVDYVNDPVEAKKLRKLVLQVAEKWHQKFTFAVSSNEDFRYDLYEYGLDYNSNEPAVLARNSQNQKFRMNGKLTAENLETFVKTLDAGKMEPFIRSQEASDNSEGVKIAVAKNFDEVVRRDKDVLLKVYAPWCKFCKDLAPIYDELAEIMKDEDVLIVKIDASANDVPDKFEYSGYPTVFWLPKGKHDKPMYYVGLLQLDYFISYISRYATTELKGWDREGNEKGTKKDEKTEL